jgi:hypothetical protein
LSACCDRSTRISVTASIGYRLSVIGSRHGIT